MKSEHKIRWLLPIIPSVFFMTVLAILSLTTSRLQASDDLATEAVVEGQIPLFGYIENQEYVDMVEKFRAEYLSHEFIPDEGRNLGSGIAIYIGQSVGSNGRFVSPEDFNILPINRLSVTNGNVRIEFPDGFGLRFPETVIPEKGCKVARAVFNAVGDYLVLLIDASDDPPPEHIEKCLLLATLGVFGERMDGAKLKLLSVPDLYERLRGMVGDPP